MMGRPPAPLEYLPTLPITCEMNGFFLNFIDSLGVYEYGGPEGTSLHKFLIALHKFWLVWKKYYVIMYT